MSNLPAIPGPAARPSLLQRVFASVSYRNYRLVWLGSCTEHIGEFMEIAAMLWLVNDLTHSPFLLTVVGAFRFLPMVVFSMLGGVATDRMNRRNLLVITLVAFGLVSLVLGFLVSTGSVALWHILVAALLVGVITSFNHPARASMVPNLVKKEHLLNAISLDSASVMAARVVGMPIAGLAIAAWGVTPIFFLRVFGAALAIVWLSFVKVPPTPAEAKKRNPWKNLVEGLHFVAGHGIVLSLVIIYLLPQFANQSYTNFLPIYATDIFQVGASGYGFLQAAPGLGSVVILFFLASLGAGRHKAWLLFASGMVLGLSVAAMAVTSWYPGFLLLLVISGGMGTAFMALSTTLIQNIISDDIRGRVMSLREISFGLGPALSLIIGGMAQTTGVPLAMAILGMVCFLVPLVFVAAAPKLRRLD
ncbi:MAG: MFS transporter [Chloroflexi bacterium]|nr:MFS transporter [Chloroflexota bacterium]